MAKVPMKIEYCSPKRGSNKPTETPLDLSQTLLYFYLLFFVLQHYMCTKVLFDLSAKTELKCFSTEVFKFDYCLLALVNYHTTCFLIYAMQFVLKVSMLK